MDKIHISFDSEAWGTRAGCDARSFGAIVFDPLSEDIFPEVESFYIACDNPLSLLFDLSLKDKLTPRELDLIDGKHRKYDLFRDPQTVLWWHDQSDEAQATFTNPVDLKEALLELSYWLEEVGVDRGKDNSCIWTHGAAFDLPLLEAMYRAVGLHTPWFYRAPRDTRTVFDLAQVGNHSEWLKQHEHGIKHHSRDDAITQAKGVNGACRRIGIQTWTRNLL